MLRGADDFPKPCWTYAERRGNDPKLFLGNDRSPWLAERMGHDPKFFLGKDQNLGKVGP